MNEKLYDFLALLFPEPGFSNKPCSLALCSRFLIVTTETPSSAANTWAGELSNHSVRSLYESAVYLVSVVSVAIELNLKSHLPQGIQEEVTDLIWHCPKCGGSNERMEAVPGSWKFWLFGKRRTKLIAICIDCWAEMDFVGTF
jgi:hypothetical protein